MSTDALIASLAAQAHAVPRAAAARRLLMTVLSGAAITLLLVYAALLFRPDLARATGTFPFWMKAGYTVATGLLATLALLRLARPEPLHLRALWPLAVPAAVLAVIAAVQLADTSLPAWPAMWLGTTWQQCSLRIALLSMPILAALLHWLRGLAPTRLRAAGAVAGAAAGGLAATLYGLHCEETTAPFTIAWYSLGIAMAALAGALLGPRALRW